MASSQEQAVKKKSTWIICTECWRKTLEIQSKDNIYIYCITAARSITVRRSSTDDHGCSASIMLAMVSSLPRVPSSFCLLFALRWLRNTRKSVARTKQCCLLSQERNLQRSPKSKCFRVFPIRNLLFVKNRGNSATLGFVNPTANGLAISWPGRYSEKRDVVMLKIVKDC